MRIGVIDVTRLTRVRKTFRPGWRIFVILTFLFIASIWWAAFHRVEHVREIANDNSLRLQAVLLGALLLTILGVASFKKTGYARLTFALITFFNVITLLPLTIVTAIVLVTMWPWADGFATFVFVMGALVAVAIFKDQLIGPGYILFLSVKPFGRAKAFRNQVASSVLLWSGHWKSREEPPTATTGERLKEIAGARYRLVLGLLWFNFGANCWLLGLMGLINPKFLPAVFDLQFTEAWHMLRDLEGSPPPSSNTEILLQLLHIGVVAVLGLCCFFVYGHFSNQWKRENTLIFRGSILQHITPSDVLLLRTFKDDVKTINREQRTWAIPFRVYFWVYTFEQLIAERLRYLGKVRLLDIERENEELLKRPWLSRMVAPQRLQRFLISVLPALWFKLPPKGGIRHYVDTREDPLVWQPEVAEAMRTARMIVVLLGTTESLKWEMDQVQKSRLLEKTIFLMPPAAFKKQYRLRWERFINYLNENGVSDTGSLQTVKVKQVRAVCVHHDVLLIITGKLANQTFYESALDIATLFTLADPARSRGMIHKYLN